MNSMEDVVNMALNAYEEVHGKDSPMVTDFELEIRRAVMQQYNQCCVRDHRSVHTGGIVTGTTAGKFQLNG